MVTKRLNEDDWVRYFDKAAGELLGRTATVEVVGPDVGAQFAAVGVGVIGITYDPKDRLLEVALDGMDHLIRHPQEIYVDETAQGLTVVQATDGSGQKHIVQIASH